MPYPWQGCHARVPQAEAERLTSERALRDTAWAAKKSDFNDRILDTSNHIALLRGIMRVESILSLVKGGPVRLSPINSTYPTRKYASFGPVRDLPIHSGTFHTRFIFRRSRRRPNREEGPVERASLKV